MFEKRDDDQTGLSEQKKSKLQINDKGYQRSNGRGDLTKRQQPKNSNLIKPINEIQRLSK